MTTTLTGASDDLIELDGDIREEWTCPTNHDGEDQAFVSFSDGTLVRIRYTGVWRIEVVAHGPASVYTIDRCEEGPDGDGVDGNYSDKLTIEGVTWAVLGTESAVAKS